MRRTRRLTAAQAAELLYPSSSDSDSDHDSSSDSESDNGVNQIADSSQSHESGSETAEWKIINEDEDYYAQRILPPDVGMNFELTSGITVDNIDFFVKLFLTEELFEMISTFTNKKARMTFEEADVEPGGDLHGPLARWRPVKAYEIKKFLGILICMQIKKKIRSYWSITLFTRATSSKIRNVSQEIVLKKSCDFLDSAIMKN